MVTRRPVARKGDRTLEMLPVRERLGSVLAALGDGEKVMLTRLWQNWEMVMGPELSTLAWPLDARGDTLVIGGEDNLALQELSFMTPEILERANAFMAAPTFAKDSLELVMGRQPLDQPPDMQPCTRVRPAPPMPPGLGGPLREMRPDSPVTRCYLAYLRMFGLTPDTPAS